MKAALIASCLAALAGGFGGLLGVLWPRMTRSAYDSLLGFSAGVMLAAGSITLLGPALTGTSLPAVLSGLACGALLVFGLERLVPHMEPHFAPNLSDCRSKRLGILMASALTLHHLPEGLAIGVAFAGHNQSLGLVVAVAIALQNIPEGLAVSMPLRSAGMSKPRAVLWATLSGTAEPLAAMLGVWFVSIVGDFVPFALALASGAMIFVASDQLIPESRQQPDQKAPSLSLICGFVLVAGLTARFR